MPYVDKERRAALDPLLAPLLIECKAVGDMSYCVTRLAQQAVRNLGGRAYINVATVDGVLDLTRAEFIRRLVEPYEDQKCKGNGDVY